MKLELTWHGGQMQVRGGVADAKHKRINVYGIERPDLYQVLSTRWQGVSSGLLVDLI